MTEILAAAAPVLAVVLVMLGLLALLQRRHIRLLEENVHSLSEIASRAVCGEAAAKKLTSSGSN